MITDRFVPEPRASAYLFQELGESLVARGHEVTVLTRMPTQRAKGSGAVPKAEQLGGLRILRVGVWGFLERWVLLRAVDQVANAVMITVKYCTIPRPDATIVYSPPLPLVMTAVVHRRLRKIPYVLHLHDLYPTTAVDLGFLKNRFLIRVARRMESLAYGNAAQIVVAAPRTRCILTNDNGVPPSRVHVVPNWVNTDSCAPGPKENNFRRAQGLSGYFVVLYAGVMGFAQDLSTVIDCARSLQTRADIIFILVGEGIQAERWRKMAAGLPNVRFLRWLEAQEYTEALRAADVCMVSLSTNLKSPASPGKIPTIMSVGRPLLAIVPEWSDVIPIIRESQGGIVLQPGHPEDLREVLEKLYSDPTLGEQMGKNARRYAEQHFALEMAVSHFESVLDMAVQTV